MDLQELISRGRFLFSGAEKRLQIFKLINGKNSAKDISKKVGRSLSAVLQDIQKLKDFELVTEKTDGNNNLIKKENSAIYEKNSLVKHVPLNYFQPVADTRKIAKIRK